MYDRFRRVRLADIQTAFLLHVLVVQFEMFEVQFRGLLIRHLMLFCKKLFLGSSVCFAPLPIGRFALRDPCHVYGAASLMALILGSMFCFR